MTGAWCHRATSAIAGAGLAALTLALHSCAGMDGWRAGAGLSGSLADLAERRSRSEDEERHDGLLVNGASLDLRGRAIQADASLGTALFQVILGREWGRLGGEDYEADLVGARVMLGGAERCAGPYAALVVRHVIDADVRRGAIDGADVACGYIQPLRSPWCADLRLQWSFLDGDAVRAGADSQSELRLACGLRLEF